MRIHKSLEKTDAGGCLLHDPGLSRGVSCRDPVGESVFLSTILCWLTGTWERGHSQEEPSQDWIGQAHPLAADLGQAVKPIWVSVSAYKNEN